MDGGAQAKIEVETFGLAPRCGWCGLRMAEEDVVSFRRRLCRACFDILGHVDWVSILSMRK
jgi:hypothetical protein